jgi:hypothetical protein
MNATVVKGGVVTAEAVSPVVPSHVAEPKVGHRCCGCCCDSRRAVIIVEIIFGMVFNGIAILLAFSAANVANNTVAALDDDSYDSLVADVNRAAAVSSSIYGVGMVVSLIVIYGAVSYRSSLVALGIVWTVVQTVIGIVFQAKAYTDYGYSYPIYDAVMRIGVSGLLIYPLAIFIHEVKRGVMSKETYPREEHSCCCV